jgi:hypothetical protein
VHRVVHLIGVAPDSHVDSPESIWESKWPNPISKFRCSRHGPGNFLKRSTRRDSRWNSNDPKLKVTVTCRCTVQVNPTVDPFPLKGTSALPTGSRVSPPSRPSAPLVSVSAAALRLRLSPRCPRALHHRSVPPFRAVVAARTARTQLAATSAPRLCDQCASPVPPSSPRGLRLQLRRRPISDGRRAPRKVFRLLHR